ncbi:MAG TPA: tetratricopeptide repeat protein [Aggregatilineales bacterium]|nr:tetratricopeptide repeat protein [Aggregatilineales bacterium]
MSPEADALKEEGLRLFRIGEHTQALDHFEQAYDAYMAAERPLDAAEMLNNIGVIWRMEDDTGAAAVSLERAREIFAEHGDRSREAQVLGNLAPLYSKQGRIDEAIAAYRTAAEMFGELGDKDRQGETLLALGILQFREGQRQAGLASYEAGLMLIKNPTPKQKRTRMLLKMRKRVTGS